MNANTREALKKFVWQIQNLAIHLTGGGEVARRIIEAAENLRDALDKDETIL